MVLFHDIPYCLNVIFVRKCAFENGLQGAETHGLKDLHAPVPWLLQSVKILLMEGEKYPLFHLIFYLNNFPAQM